MRDQSQVCSSEREIRKNFMDVDKSLTKWIAEEKKKN